MTDLISKTDISKMCDALQSGGAPSKLVGILRDYQEILDIKDWDDYKRVFFMGNGLSAGTYQTYMVAAKGFYSHTKGLSPMAAGTPGWIESYYDSLNGLDLNTKCLRMRSLKKMYSNLETRFPFITSPFDSNEMNEVLNRKLFKSKRDESERDAFTEKEYQSILRMLKADESPEGLFKYGLFRFGVTSGMRAQELVNLRWENIQKTETGYSATFIGKGDKVRTIQLEVQAYQAVRKAFRARFDRAPKSPSFVFNSQTGEGTSKPTIHTRIKEIAEAAKAAGIVRQNLLVSTHVLRHTCATRLLGAGVDVHSVSRHLGHSSVATTDRYLHNNADLTEAYRKMSGEAA